MDSRLFEAGRFLEEELEAKDSAKSRKSGYR
jgi:hypothetical protein